MFFEFQYFAQVPEEIVCSAFVGLRNLGLSHSFQQAMLITLWATCLILAGAYREASVEENLENLEVDYEPLGMLPVCAKFTDYFLRASSSQLQNVVIGNEKILRKTCHYEMDALLDTAIKTHDASLTERVVKYVGNVNAKSRGVSVLHWAAESGDLKIVKLLLDGGDGLLQVFLTKLEPKTYQNDTPLHWAAGKGHLEIVQELVKRGAKVNRKNEDGMTPLHLAAQRDRVNVVKFLLANGADVDVKTGMFSGKKAYDVAATDEIKELVKPKK
eukprot:s1967_g10.t1